MTDLKELLTSAAVDFLPDTVPPLPVVQAKAKHRRTRIRLGLAATALAVGAAVVATALVLPGQAHTSRLPVASGWVRSGSEYVMAVKGDPVVAGVAFGHRVAWVQAPKPATGGAVGSYRIGTPGARVVSVHDLETGRDWTLKAQTPTGTIADVTADGDKVVTTEVVDAKGCAGGGFCATWSISVYDLKTGDISNLDRSEHPGTAVPFPVVGDGYAAWVVDTNLHYESLEQGPDGSMAGEGGIWTGDFEADSVSIAGHALYVQRHGDARTLFTAPLPQGTDGKGNLSGLGAPKPAATDTYIGSPTVSSDGVMAWTTRRPPDAGPASMELRRAPVDHPQDITTVLTSGEIYGLSSGDSWIVVDDLEGPQLISTRSSDVTQLSDKPLYQAAGISIVGKTLFYGTYDDETASSVTLHVRLLP